MRSSLAPVRALMVDEELADVLVVQAYRGARVQRLARFFLLGYGALVLALVPPSGGRVACWVVLGCYAVVAAGLGWLIRTGQPRDLLWIRFTPFVDILALAALSVVVDASSDRVWTTYLLVQALLLVPLLGATQLSPTVCGLLAVPTVVVYLTVSVLTRRLDGEPFWAVLLSVLLLLGISGVAVALSGIQLKRVVTIGGLVSERSKLLAQMVSVEERERQQLSETVHDGALQYLLSARQDLEDLGVDRASWERIDYALAEASRLLRSIMRQLHPAVLEAAGLPPVLGDAVEAAASRGALRAELDDEGWPQGLRTTADALLVTTAQELLTNVVKHARARTVRVTLTWQDGVARLQVRDDGRGLRPTDLDKRLEEGHVGLASRRLRVAALGGHLSIHPVEPSGTQVSVEVPAQRIGPVSR